MTHSQPIRILIICIIAGACAGCSGQGVAFPSLFAPPPSLAHLSLNDIGERAIDTAEDLEEDGLYIGALEAYRRAQWAFQYQETLTGRQPLLLAEANEGVRRLASKSPPMNFTK